MSPPRRPWRRVDGGLELDLRVQPGAKADRIEGLAELDDGACVLKVRIKAPPADGKANRALIALLAKRWKLAKSDVALVSGESGRRKRVRLTGDSEALAATLDADLDGTSAG